MPLALSTRMSHNIIWHHITRWPCYSSNYCSVLRQSSGKAKEHMLHCCCRARIDYMYGLPNHIQNNRRNYELVRVRTSSCFFYSLRKNILGYSTSNHKFKRSGPHFETTARRSGREDISEPTTAVAFPQSREYTKEPISALPTNGSMEKFRARAQLRNILQEKVRGRGGSSCRFDRRFRKTKSYCGHCNTGGDWFGPL